MAENINKLVQLEIKHMSESITDLKESISKMSVILEKVSEVNIRLGKLEERMVSSNAKHDEGRKVIHKRLDVYFKLIFWVGTTIFSAMGGVIYVLLQEIYSK